MGQFKQGYWTDMKRFQRSGDITPIPTYKKSLCVWTVQEDTVPTNVYTSSYLSYRTVQYGSHSSEVAQSIHSVIPAASRTVAQT